MCALRTSDARPALAGRTARIAAAGMAVALAGLVAAPATAQDDKGGRSAQFHSFVPAPTRIDPPNLEAPDLWASEREKAYEAYSAGDFAAAREHLEQSAENGDLIATWYLGNMYRLGQGVDVDNAKALARYEKVAAAFAPDEPNRQVFNIMIDSLVRVADYYRKGDETAAIERNPRRAFDIYKVASTYGHPAAQYALGVMYFDGTGVRRNREQGVRWLTLAARKRFAPAEAMLGDMYWSGDYVHQNRTRGLMWYMLAQESVRPEEHPEIVDRFDVLMAGAEKAERDAAKTMASSWSAKFPISK